MRPSLWQHYLSHITEIHIESAPSEYNPHLYVSLNQGRYQLCTANVVYSFEDLYDNFGIAFQKIDLDKIPGERVLILGFGLGSIPYILEKKWHKQYHYTAVEIDESVLYLANKYMMPEMESSIETICADAFAFVMQSREKFDLIAMDVFLDDIIPDDFQNDTFLEHLEKLLNPDGVLLYNRLAHTPTDRHASQRYFSDVFEPRFPKGGYIEVKGNWMLLNDKKVLL